MIQKIKNMIQDGLSIKQIAIKLNSNYSAIYQAIKRHKIKYNKQRQGGSNLIDLSGKTINGLQIVSRAKSPDRKIAYWNCICPCGKNFIACGSDIRQGKTRTCGCRISIKNKRNWQGFGCIPKRVWSNINSNANQRNIEIKVSVQYLDRLFKKQDGFCKLSGLPISFVDKTASLDRIDNSKGYVNGNVQWVHKDVNKLKGTFELHHFLMLCKMISNN